MALETLLVERDGPVAIVTLNRPKALNALSQALLAELSGVVAAIAADDEVRAVVIIGAGDRAFAAGAAWPKLRRFFNRPPGPRGSRVRCPSSPTSGSAAWWSRLE